MSTSKIDEFAINLPVSSPAPDYAVADGYAGASSVVMAPAGDTTSSIAIGAPMAEPVDPKTITVYANSINPISYNGEADGVAAFDIVFSVGVSCGDGSCKTYQVVKRIGIDKTKIAAEVESESPMSIVEAIKAVDPEDQYVIKMTIDYDPKKVVTYFCGPKGSSKYAWNPLVKHAKVYDSMSEVAKAIQDIDRNDEMAKKDADGKFKNKIEGVLLSKQDVKESVNESVKRARQLAGLE